LIALLIVVCGKSL